MTLAIKDLMAGQPKDKPGGCNEVVNSIQC
jgi:hypothetical protein